MLIPLKIETPITRWPITNMVLIVFTTIFFFLVALNNIPEDVVRAMVLRDWDIAGIFGCLFLHSGLLHLIGNMLFLWIFGNAICGYIGNGWYLPIYFFLGLCASSMALALGEVPAIGASGAINGIVGMSLFLFPTNKLKVFMVFFGIMGTKRVPCSFIIALWFILDLFSALYSSDGVGHWAHIGGLLGGVAVGVILYVTGWITTYDATLWDVITGNTENKDILEEKALLKMDGTPVLAAEYDETVPLGEATEMHELMLEEKYNQYKYSPRELLRQTATVSPLVEVAEEIPVAKPIVQTEPPRIRILRSVEKDGAVYCYFVNEGGAVENLRVSTGDGIHSSIQPTGVIKKMDTGFIKLEGCSLTQDVAFQLSFKLGEKRLVSRIGYSAKDKKFLAR